MKTTNNCYKLDVNEKNYEIVIYNVPIIEIGTDWISFTTEYNGGRVKFIMPSACLNQLVNARNMTEQIKNDKNPIEFPIPDHKFIPLEPFKKG